MEDEQEGSEAEGSRGKAGESLKPQASQVGTRRKQGSGLEKGLPGRGRSRRACWVLRGRRG